MMLEQALYMEPGTAKFETAAPLRILDWRGHYWRIAGGLFLPAHTPIARARSAVLDYAIYCGLRYAKARSSLLG